MHSIAGQRVTLPAKQKRHMKRDASENKTFPLLLTSHSCKLCLGSMGESCLLQHHRYCMHACSACVAVKDNQRRALKCVWHVASHLWLAAREADSKPGGLPFQECLGTCSARSTPSSTRAAPGEPSLLLEAEHARGTTIRCSGVLQDTDCHSYMSNTSRCWKMKRV